MTQEDIFSMMPEKPLSRDAIAALVTMSEMVSRIERAKDLHAVFIIKDSTEFANMKALVAKMVSRPER